MSTGIILTENQRKIWQRYIMHLVSQCHEHKSYIMLNMLVIQLYEYIIACAPRSKNEPTKFKQLKAIVRDDVGLFYFKVLYSLRNDMCHRPFDIRIVNNLRNLASIPKQTQIRVLQDFFSELEAVAIVNCLQEFEQLGNQVSPFIDDTEMGKTIESILNEWK